MDFLEELAEAAVFAILLIENEIDNEFTNQAVYE